MEKFQCHGKAMYMKGLDCAMVKLGRAYTEELGKKIIQIWSNGSQVAIHRTGAFALLKWCFI